MCVYTEFSIVSVDTDIMTRSITITATFDVDAGSVNQSTVQLYSDVNKNYVAYDAVVQGKVITLTLHDWPSTNTDYILSISKIKNVLGAELANGNGIFRKIIFSSNVTSSVEITYPAYNEVINDLKAEWIEDQPNPNGELANSFYIEVSSDVAFYNIVKSTLVVGRNNIDLSDIPNGQYFMRIRAQKDNAYGAWSDVVSFIVQTGAVVPEEPDDEQSMFVQELNLVSSPLNGETPGSFVFEFDAPLGVVTIENIIVTRSGV